VQTIMQSSAVTTDEWRTLWSCWLSASIAQWQGRATHSGEAGPSSLRTPDRPIGVSRLFPSWTTRCTITRSSITRLILSTSKSGFHNMFAHIWNCAP